MKDNALIDKKTYQLAKDYLPGQENRGRDGKPY
jgi:hypothetical protein